VGSLFAAKGDPPLGKSAGIEIGDVRQGTKSPYQGCGGG
jgi:hypothetical protein